MTSTIWKHIVEDISLDIDKLTQILLDGPMIKSSVRTVDGAYEFYLEELWPDDVTFRYQVNNDLQDRVTWCTDKLVNWQGCERIGYDTWRFTSLNELEKFSILYNLVWAQ